MKNERLVQIDWIDSTSRDGWRHVGEKHNLEAGPCRSVGYLLKKTRRSTVICHSLSLTMDKKATDAHLGHMSIPNGCITKMRYLRGR